VTVAAEPESAHPINPPVVAASVEPERAIKSVRVPIAQVDCI
jgi:hypothetical protein